jgi:hypothetical protein
MAGLASPDRDGQRVSALEDGRAFESQPALAIGRAR